MDFDEFFDFLEKGEFKKVPKLLALVTDISNMCIGDIAMGYKMDAQEIGQMIYEATGLTNPELNKVVEHLKTK